jgi:hypothetical protein
VWWWSFSMGGRVLFGEVYSCCFNAVYYTTLRIP